MWECTECFEENELDPDAEPGQVVECSECGAEFEVLRVEPVSLTPLKTGDGDGDGNDWDD